MMYLINYDLNTPGKNYNELTNAILRDYASWAKISRSCWIVRTQCTASEIRDNLRQYLDKNDILFVCSIESWATLNFNSEVIEWLTD